jgi:hypothetical protein
VHLGTSSSADFGVYPLLKYVVIAAIAMIAGSIGTILVYFTKVKKTTEKTKQKSSGPL